MEYEEGHATYNSKALEYGEEVIDIDPKTYDEMVRGFKFGHIDVSVIPSDQVGGFYEGAKLSSGFNLMCVFRNVRGVGGDPYSGSVIIVWTKKPLGNLLD